VIRGLADWTMHVDWPHTWCRNWGLRRTTLVDDLSLITAAPNLLACFYPQNCQAIIRSLEGRLLECKAQVLELDLEDGNTYRDFSVSPPSVGG